jgi:hypothetical protein
MDIPKTSLTVFIFDTSDRLLLEIRAKMQNMLSNIQKYKASLSSPTAENIDSEVAMNLEQHKILIGTDIDRFQRDIIWCHDQLIGMAKDLFQRQEEWNCDKSKILPLTPLYNIYAHSISFQKVNATLSHIIVWAEDIQYILEKWLPEVMENRKKTIAEESDETKKAALVVVDKKILKKNIRDIELLLNRITRYIPEITEIPSTGGKIRSLHDNPNYSKLYAEYKNIVQSIDMQKAIAEFFKEISKDKPWNIWIKNAVDKWEKIFSQLKELHQLSATLMNRDYKVK